MNDIAVKCKNIWPGLGIATITGMAALFLSEHYNAPAMLFALLLTLWTAKRRINRKYVHMFSLFAGAYGFISMYFITEPSMLTLSFVCIGFSWGSILSMPYAMLSSTLDPNKMGVYMGIFNMQNYFITRQEVYEKA